MRSNHGKGVAYTRINGRGVVLVTTPGSSCTRWTPRPASRSRAGAARVPVRRLPEVRLGRHAEGPDRRLGAVDARRSRRTTPAKGLPLELGYITTSSPPIVVNDVLDRRQLGRAGLQPDARRERPRRHPRPTTSKTGKFLWKFHVIPRPGEFGHETWENDAWKWTGDVSSWAPMSADPARGLVYIPTNGATIDYFGGFRPGDNLFSTSADRAGRQDRQARLAPPAGEARHLELRHADRADAAGRERRRPAHPGPVPVTKQSWVYSFNRQTGEPIWPIEMRPAPQSQVPTEKLSQVAALRRPSRRRTTCRGARKSR